MSEKIDNGGPAYGHGTPEAGGHPGMSLHDFFAAHALLGICANPHFFGSAFQQNPNAAAEFADEAADAMLAHRNKETDND